MIKLINILKEIETPINNPKGEKIAVFKMKIPDGEGDESFKRGYKSIKTITDPDTGSITTEFEALPKFDEMRRKILLYRKELQLLKYSTNPQIIKLIDDIDKLLARTNSTIFTLDKILELMKKTDG
jgi:hypothetical protein